MKDIILKLLGLSLEPKHIEMIDDTTERTGLNGFAIQVLEEAVIDTITYIPGEQSIAGTYAGKTLIAGSIHYVRHSTLELTSGVVVSLGKVNKNS